MSFAKMMMMVMMTRLLVDVLYVAPRRGRAGGGINLCWLSQEEENVLHHIISLYCII